MIDRPRSTGGYGEADTWTPDERTVRHVAAVLNGWADSGLSDGTNGTLRAAAHDILRECIAQPDPIEALVEEFDNADGHLDTHGWNAIRTFTRWLHDGGRLK